MSQTKLYRDKENQMIGGVCSGIADVYGFDVSIVRLIAVAIAFAYGTGIVLYIVAMVIMPLKEEVVNDEIRKDDSSESKDDIEEVDESPIDFSDDDDDK